MASETGHNPSAAYFSQNGDLHLNGANAFDGAENTIPQKLVYTIAQGGSSNICLVSITVQDAKGNALAAVFELEWYLSDSSVGNGLTATTASGAVAASTNNGSDLFNKVSKKANDSITDNTGVYQLSITDTAKTGFYVAAVCPGTGVTWVSRQLVSGDYK